MKKPRAARRVAKPAVAGPGRRVVVLLSELVVSGVARPLPAGRVVEAAAERFKGLHRDHVRDATEADVAVAGSALIRLDLEPSPEPVAEPEPPAEAAD